MIGQPFVRKRRDDGLQCRLGQQGREPRTGGDDVSGERQQDVILDERESRAGAALPPVCTMVEVERRPVVDQIIGSLPEKQVGVSCGAIDVGDECVEPDDRRREVRIDGVIGGRIEGERARKIGEPGIRADTTAQDILNLWVRLTLAETRAEFDQCGRWDREAE